MLFVSAKCLTLAIFVCATSTHSKAQQSDTVYDPVSEGSVATHLSEWKKTKRWPTAGLVWKNAVLGTPRDFREMAKIVSKDWKKTAVHFGGVALFIAADRPVTQFFQDKIERNLDYHLGPLPTPVNSIFWGGTNTYLNYSLLGLYGGSLAVNYKKGQRASLNAIKALTYSYLISHVGAKAIFARQRPDATLSDGIPPQPPSTTNPFNFFNFRGISLRPGGNASAFPSMHATAYYAVAKVLAMEFNNYWISYGVTTFLFFSQLEAHRHWVGDMVAGGLLGTVIGKGVVMSSRRQEKRQQEEGFGIKRHPGINFKYRVLPAISSSAGGFTLIGTF